LTGVSHPVWFERPVPPEFADEIGPRIEVSGPGTGSDPFFGIESAAGVIASVLRYDGPVMDRASRALAIVRTGIGYDRVDVDAATKRGIAVCNTPNAPTVSTAEHTIALLLAVTKGVYSSADRLRRGDNDLYTLHEAIELEGKTLGLVGFGRIARRVAAVARSLGMHVVAFDPFLAQDAEAVTRIDDLDELLNSADVVSVHVPLTGETKGLFDQKRFAAMKPGSFLINTSRGGVVDQDALVTALATGHLRGAALDVTDPEPLPADHPLLHRSDVVVTPHVASATAEGKRRILRSALAEVLAVLDGRQPEYLINPEVWPPQRRVAT
jgi:phosphoglycerate dehydrogenase-like enzyme